MLNFDPDRWLEENKGPPEISRIARLARSTSDDGNQALDALESENRSFSEGKQKSEMQAPPANSAYLLKSDVQAWIGEVSELDRHQPPEGFDRTRWLNLAECSVWWLESFGRQAALDGWTSIDVFGLNPETPGAGGLIDRLGTSRSLVMEGKRARWRSFGLPMKFNAGAYQSLPLFWEICDQ